MVVEKPPLLTASWVYTIHKLEKLHFGVTNTKDLKLERSIRKWAGSSHKKYPLHLNVGQYLYIVSQNYDSWDDDLCEKLCTDFELEKSKRLIHLSMGENSKVRLVKALSFQPSLVILDELTANLSPKSKEALTRSLIELFSERKMSVLYICHSDEEAIRLSDRIYLMEKNGLKQTGGQNA
jgi:ABC-type multidrug transport system ATPase subunit